MFLFYFSITLAIASSALYHFSQKRTPANVNPAVSISVSYVVAFVLTLSLLFFLPAKNGIIARVRQLNWASYQLAFSIVGLEVGFLFQEELSLDNIIGILVCLAGLVMLNWKR